MLGHGITVGHNTVSLLMRRAELAGLPTPSRAKLVPATVTVTEMVKRKFTRDAPHQLWVTDITEHPTREGKLYCCVVLDAFSRRVVGWAIDSRQRADLATNALGIAIDSRGAVDAAIIHGARNAVHFVELHPAGRVSIGWQAPLDFERNHSRRPASPHR